MPEETFSSAKATVKVSLVFLRRFTEADETEWEAAWEDAHTDHDATFDDKRNALCAQLGRQIVTGGSVTVARIVDELAVLGVERVQPAWSAGMPPAYPRGIGQTGISGSRWRGKTTNANRATQLKRDYAAAFDSEPAIRSKALLGELRASLRSIDETHNAALWGVVREAFDYPVFVAAPQAVGITSTGETGEDVPDELPTVLDAYRAFETWVKAGASPEETPDFRLSSAV